MSALPLQPQEDAPESPYSVELVGRALGLLEQLSIREVEQALNGELSTDELSDLDDWRLDRKMGRA